MAPDNLRCKLVLPALGWEITEFESETWEGHGGGGESSQHGVVP